MVVYLVISTCYLELVVISFHVVKVEDCPSASEPEELDNSQRGIVLFRP